VQEKHLTLALARAVAERLERRHIPTRLTREGDEYVSLRERTRRANASGAALFISLHANASPAHSQRGFETYLLTPQALDVDARALRVHEGRPRPGVAPDTAILLDDVERGLAHRSSAGLAAAVQEQLAARRDPGTDRGVRQASMDVLYGATMPAVLVEVGFIDHPVEGPELLDPAVLAELADAIADAAASQLAIEIE
jgi:N-acetylmuramoyl-L-alanine amidase